MGLFDKKQKAGGLMDEIRCDEQSYLIWKWHPYGSQQNQNIRENAIRWGSSLRVKDGEVAVFVYKQANGEMQDYITGPYDQMLDVKNLPILASIIGAAYDRGTPFQAEVYFINLSQIVQTKFAVPFFDIYDPRFEDFGVPVAVRGTITFHITDYKEFIKLHRLINFDITQFQTQIRDAASRYVKDCVANAPATHNIPVIQIETKTSQINDIIEYDLGERMSADFGITVSGIDIGAIEIDKSSTGYQQLMSITRDVVGAKIEAQTTDYIEKLRIQREEGQYALHKQTQSANIGAFQIEKQAEIGIAGAEALGKIGSTGSADINLGNGSDGFNMASIMASMAVGGAVGQNIAGAMSNVMNMTPLTSSSEVTPPPIPTSLYHVVIDGKAAGPFDMQALKHLVEVQQLSSDTLVWMPGMERWTKAKAVEELRPLFNNVPPPIPSEE